MVRLDNSYKSFFGGKGFPRWANKKRYNSLSVRDGMRIINNKISIQKMGFVKMYKDAPINGNIKQIIIKIEPTGFFASILCEVNSPNFVPKTNSIGVDMGLTYFAVTSDGDYINNPIHFKRHERKLRIENRSLSRKKKFSKSWYKQVKKVGLLHHKIANVRRDFLHKQSTLIAKANNIVYMEDLNISGMSKNKNLSKHILDAGWGRFRIMLEYKTNVVAINPAYTSQTCNECGVVDSLSRTSQSVFKCTECGHSANADVNAAKNIKSKGIAFVRQRETLACA